MVTLPRLTDTPNSMKGGIKDSVDRALEKLPKQQRRVLMLRHGLQDGKPQRLQKIGDTLSLTRERIRQIQSAAFATLNKDECVKELSGAVGTLEYTIRSCGGAASEKTICHICDAAKPTDAGYLRLLLTCFDIFTFASQDDNLHPFWSLSQDQVDSTRKVVNAFHKKVKKDRSEIFSKEGIFSILHAAARETFGSSKKQPKDAASHEELVKLSKFIKKNKFNEWGHRDNPEIALSNIGGYIRFVMRKKNRPMHFDEITKEVAKLRDAPTHTSTCHNELVNKEDFVLVGRGIYALANDGYQPGTVTDIIKHLITKHGPLDRKMIMKRVKDERIVQDATIAQALTNRSNFTLGRDKKYSLA